MLQLASYLIKKYAQTAMVCMLFTTPCMARDALGDLSHTAITPSAVEVTTTLGHQVRFVLYPHNTVRVQTKFGPNTPWTDEAKFPVLISQAVSQANWQIQNPTQATLQSYQPLIQANNALLVSAGAQANWVLLLQKSPFRFGFYAKPSPSNSNAIPYLTQGDIYRENGRLYAESSSSPNQHFAGLGHGFYGRVNQLDLKGQTIERNYGSQERDQSPLLVPFYLSSFNYGVFVNSSQSNRFEFNAQTRFSINDSAQTQVLDFFVMLGDQLADVVMAYADLTGRPRLPPKSMFGVALSDKYHQTKLGGSAINQTWWMNKIQQQREAGLPIDVVINDNQWRAGGGQRCQSYFAWETQKYPSPRAYQTWLQSQGLLSALDFNRCNLEHSQGYLAKWAITQQSFDFESAISSPDLTRSDMRRWWWEQNFWKNSLNPSLAYPGDSLWIDEFDNLGQIPASTLLSNGLRWDFYRNQYFLQIAKSLVEEGWESDLGDSKRPFVWLRGNGAGGQRYSTLWSGDINSSYSEMQQQIRGMQAASLSGFSFWVHDAGGFHGNATQSEFDAMYADWSAAMGSFSPIWKPHGVNYSRWPVDQRKLQQIIFKTFAQLRYSLLPYTYSHAYQAATRGMPLVRPLLLDFSGEEKAWSQDLSYLWGPDLLVVPRISSSEKSRDLWLPPSDWYDFWSDKPYVGGQNYTWPMANGYLPLFVKAGAIIPMQTPQTSIQAMQNTPFTVHVYAGAANNFALYDDDGKTEHYRRGDYQAWQINSDGQHQIQLTPTQTNLDTPNGQRRIQTWVLHGFEEGCVSLNDQPLTQVNSLVELASLPSGFAHLKTAARNQIYVKLDSQGSDAYQLNIAGNCTDNWQRFEAENAKHDGIVRSKMAASGQALVGNFKSLNQSIQQTIQVAQSGYYLLNMGYANGRDYTASRDLLVDGKTLRTVRFPSLGHWERFEQIRQIPLYLNAGSHTLTLKVTDSLAQAVDIDYFELLRSPLNPAMPALESGNRLEIAVNEAIYRSQSNTHHWQVMDDEQAVQALPNNQTLISDQKLNQAPYLEYLLTDMPTGTYYVWVLMDSQGSGNDNSIHITFDKAAEQSATNISSDQNITGYVWSNLRMDGSRAKIMLNSAQSLLRLSMREDGTKVAKIMLTQDPSYQP